MSYKAQPLFYCREYTECGYPRRDYVASHAARIQPIADSLIEACRDENYSSPESAARSRARLLGWRDRGVTHTTDMWRADSITVRYVQYRDGDWSTPEVCLPTDAHYIDPAYKAFKRIRERLWKARLDWRDPSQLETVLAKLGYRRAYLVTDGSYLNETPVMLRADMTALEPLEPCSEPAQYALTSGDISHE